MRIISLNMLQAASEAPDKSLRKSGQRSQRGQRGQRGQRNKAAPKLDKHHVDDPTLATGTRGIHSKGRHRHETGTVDIKRQLATAVASRIAGSYKMAQATQATQATVARAGASNRPSLRATRAGIRKLQQRLIKEHPVLRAEAKKVIEARLLAEHGLRVDADHTYFNVFTGGRSSGYTYNGWEHQAPVVSSRSLTDMQMRNFVANLGEDPNGLNANSGIYTDGAEASDFGVHNEVRLLSTQLKRAVRDNDLYTHYHAKLQAYWDKNLDAVGRIYRKMARLALRRGYLSAAGKALLRQALRQANGHHDGAPLVAHVFDIDGYPSKDMTWLESPQGHVLLLMPGNPHPLREYVDVAAMRADIEAMLRTPAGRHTLALHFSLYYRDDGVTYQGVDKWLDDIATGNYRARIAYAATPVTGNIFHDLAVRTRDAELDDVKRLVKSNGEVDEEECTQFVHVLSFMLPWLFLPAKAVEFGLNLHQAVADGASGDRRAAAGRAGVNFAELALAILPGLRFKSVPNAATAVAERAAFFKWPTRTADGRIGYVLGPLDAPQPRDHLLEAFEQAAAEAAADAVGGEEELLPSPPPSRSPSPLPSPGTSRSSSLPRYPSSMSPSPSPSGSFRAGSWVPGQELGYGRPATPQPGPSRLVGISDSGGMLRYNELGWLEHLGIDALYRAEPLRNLAVNSPEVHGFAADMNLEGNRLSTNDRYLHTLLSQDEARAYGNRVYGEGNFALYRIDSRGLPAISYRTNVNYDVWRSGVFDEGFLSATPEASGDAASAAAAPETGAPTAGTRSSASSPAPDSAHAGPPPIRIPDGFEMLDARDQEAYDCGYVFLDIRELRPDQIHRIS